MVKVPDLNRVVGAFERSHDEAVRTWITQYDNRVALGHSVLREATIGLVMSTARNWEVFRSDWHKAAVSQDATLLRDDIEDRVMSHIKTRDQSLSVSLEELGIQASVQIAKHPTLRAVSLLLDATDRNLSFPTQNVADDMAKRQLAPYLAFKACSLSLDDWKLIALLGGVRNVIAHSSVQSVTRMNDAIRNMQSCSGSTSHLRRLARIQNRVTRKGIGSYLYARVADAAGHGSCRALVLADETHRLAQHFRV